MASPADRSINDWLNKRLERTEFMPFAPVVRDERVDEAFELPPALHYTARYMTVTCNVKPQWRDRIPAVVHSNTWNFALPGSTRRLATWARSLMNCAL